jgi:hypothetical protein
MKSLELEAFDYAKDNRDLIDPEFQAFMAGANSKWAQADKIRAQIEVLKECTNVPDFEWKFSRIGRKIIELQQQLKQLKESK